MPSTIIPPSLSHFVIFNPTLKPPPEETLPRDENTERDADLEDDLRQAAQILFYTSRESGGVSRDKMLRQTGLVKGIMGFTDMVVKNDNGRSFWSIRSHRSRLLVYVPEPDFYIYVNITLSQTIPDTTADGKKEKEPIVTSQGLSDNILVDALAMGYEDFRLLNGPLSDLLPPSPTLSSLLDKFWTRFAFSFESTHLSSPSTLDSLITWIGGYPSASDHIASAIQRAMEVFIDDADLSSDTAVGVIHKDGPLYTTPASLARDTALIRYLTGLVQGSLPPPAIVEAPRTDARQSLGFGMGRKKDDNSTANTRKTSWATFSSAAVGWVPTLGGSTPRSITPVSADPGARDATSAVAAEKEKDKPRWSFGMPMLGIGEAMGNMGTALGLGGSTRHDVRATHEATPEDRVTSPGPASLHSIGADEHLPVADPLGEGRVKESIEAVRSLHLEDHPATDSASSHHQDESQSDAISSHHVEQSAVDIPDLQAAVLPEEEIDLGWEHKNVWVENQEQEQMKWVKRRLTWLIRDGIMVYILHPPPQQQNTSPSLPFAVPSSRVTLALYSRLNSVFAPERSSTDSSLSRPTQMNLANSSVFASGGVTEVKGPDMDLIASTALVELKDILESVVSINEVYARTPASKFVLAKRTRTTSGHSGDPADPFATQTSTPALVPGELYMSIGRKDASLTDAEYAVRGYLRSRPELA